MSGKTTRCTERGKTHQIFKIYWKITFYYIFDSDNYYHILNYDNIYTPYQRTTNIAKLFRPPQIYVLTWFLWICFLLHIACCTDKVCKYCHSSKYGNNYRNQICSKRLFSNIFWIFDVSFPVLYISLSFLTFQYELSASQRARHISSERDFTACRHNTVNSIKRRR
jgi:hypothetical protein